MGQKFLTQINKITPNCLDGVLHQEYFKLSERRPLGGTKVMYWSKEDCRSQIQMCLSCSMYPKIISVGKN